MPYTPSLFEAMHEYEPTAVAALHTHFLPAFLVSEKLCEDSFASCVAFQQQHC